MVDQTRHFTVRTLAEYWECSETHIYNLVKSNKLQHIRIGKLIRIPFACVTEFELSNLSTLKKVEKIDSQGGLSRDAVQEFRWRRVLHKDKDIN